MRPGAWSLAAWDGQHSIRVNQRYRVCFAWTENGPEGVEFVDYH